MGDKSKIEWLDGGATWNPIRALNRKTGKRGWFCERYSPGCVGCYAERMNINTFYGNGIPYRADQLDQVELYLDETVLQQPLKWKRGRNIFPCSMTDMFARFVPNEWRDKMFSVMVQAQQHTFMCLTKRTESMPIYFSYSDFTRAISEGGLPAHIWIGTSIENKDTAKQRIPELLKVPAKTRWLSIEPLLEAIDIENYLGSLPEDEDGAPYPGEGLQWIVIGGQSGPQSRPFNPDWARDLLRQAREADRGGKPPVSVFVKQFGARVETSGCTSPGQNWPKGINLQDTGRGNFSVNLKDKKGGNMEEWPKDLRVREYPVIGA